MLRHAIALLLGLALVQGNLAGATGACAQGPGAHDEMSAGAGTAGMAHHEMTAVMLSVSADEPSSCCADPAPCDGQHGMGPTCGVMTSCATAPLPTRALYSAALAPAQTRVGSGPVLAPLARALAPELPPPRA